MLRSSFLQKLGHLPKKASPLGLHQSLLVVGFLNGVNSSSNLMKYSLQPPSHKFSTTTDEKFPTAEDVKSQPIDFDDVSDDMLFVLAKQEIHEARIERLIREIMRVDSVSRSDAIATVDVMDKKNDEMSFIIKLPYHLGIAFGLTAAFTAVPMVFHADTVVWFNDTFVGEDLPEYELDNFWRVGSWAWEWMEPFHGTLSFVLLGFAFARAQMEKIHITPFTERMRMKRAARLTTLYPQYNKGIVWDYALTDSF